LACTSFWNLNLGFVFKTWSLGYVNNYMIMSSGNEGMLEVNEGFGMEA
jgi:hypothetical protein